MTSVAGFDTDMQHLQRQQRVTASSSWGDVRRQDIHCRPLNLVAISYLASPRSTTCRHHIAVVRQDVSDPG